MRHSDESPYWEDIKEALDRVHRDVELAKKEYAMRLSEVGADESFGQYGVGWVWVDADGHRLTPAQAMKEAAFCDLSPSEQNHIRRLASDNNE